MPYIGTTPTKVVSRQSANVYRYTATAGQTAFTGADLDNQVLACNPADLAVHMNGLRLESTDYTATSTTVTLTTAATAGDELTVTSFVTFEVADTYTKTAADDRYVNTTGDTMTGKMNVSLSSDGDILELGGPSNSLLYQEYSGTNYLWNFGTLSFGTYSNNDLHIGTNGTTRMTIDSAGRVTMPYQPAFRAYRSTDPGTNTTDGNMSWTGTEFNVGNHFANNRFTAPVSGTYIFGVNNNMGSGHSVSSWRLYKNGSYSHVLSYSDFTASWKNSSGSTLMQLQANDYIEAWWRGDADYSPDWCGFYGYLIG